jgi:hypothetical protein
MGGGDARGKMERDYSGKRLQLRFRRNLGGALKNFLDYIVDPEFADF